MRKKNIPNILSRAVFPMIFILALAFMMGGCTASAQEMDTINEAIAQVKAAGGYELTYKLTQTTDIDDSVSITFEENDVKVVFASEQLLRENVYNGAESTRKIICIRDGFCWKKNPGEETFTKTSGEGEFDHYGLVDFQLEAKWVRKVTVATDVADTDKVITAELTYSGINHIVKSGHLFDIQHTLVSGKLVYSYLDGGLTGFSAVFTANGYEIKVETTIISTGAPVISFPSGLE